MKKGPLSAEEERIVFNGQLIHGNKWADIAKLLKGRTDNVVKNHFYSTLRRQLRNTMRKALGDHEAEPEEISVEYFKKMMTDLNLDYSMISNPNLRDMLMKINDVEIKERSVPKPLKFKL